MTFFVGLITGVICAFLQSVSYLFSARYQVKYHSTLELLVFSHLGMAAMALPLLAWFLPHLALAGAGNFFGTMMLWALFFFTGHVMFFLVQKHIESSRLASLLGLKVITLALLTWVLQGKMLNPVQWLAVVVCAGSALTMNWSGGARFSRIGLLLLAVNLVAYSLTDMAETCMVVMQKSGSLFHDAMSVIVTGYVGLGILMLPLLRRTGWDARKFVTALPFGATWLLSQLALLVCFGLVGAVFGNIVQSSRGIFSVLLGMLVLRLGRAELDSKVSGAMWFRRAAAALGMMAGIAIYVLGSGGGAD